MDIGRQGANRIQMGRKEYGNHTGDTKVVGMVGGMSKIQNFSSRSKRRLAKWDSWEYGLAE